MWEMWRVYTWVWVSSGWEVPHKSDITTETEKIYEREKR